MASTVIFRTLGKIEIISNTYHTLTIHYVDYDDNTVNVLDDYVATLNEGETYSRGSPSVEGYYDPTPDRVEGTMGTQDIVETVTYKRRMCSVLIQYKFASSGAEAATAYSATVPKGEDFVVESPVVEGYTPDRPSVTVVTSHDWFNTTVNYIKDVDPIDPDEPL